MSSKTIVTLLLMSCLAATVTALAVTEEPPQEGSVKALGGRESLTITDVRWLKNVASTNVQVCVEGNLPAGTPGLVYKDEIKQITTEGVIDDANLNCATFTQIGTYTFTENPARYELTVVSIDDPGVFLGRGVSTFAITVRSTLLTCGALHITKVTWSGSEKLSIDFRCIPGSSKSDKVCYHDGDITGTELCYVVTDEKLHDVKVCLNGPIDINPLSIDPISSNYFYYGLEAASNVPADATLSLTMPTVGVTNMRAIVRHAEDPPSTEAIREAHVYDCLPTGCTFAAYERKLATYEVCLEAMNDHLVTIETATTTFTDLKLYAFDAGFQKSMLLECVFANALAAKTYTASLLDNLPVPGVDVVPLDTSNIDCTGVSANHGCFGYLDTGTITGTVVYVTVSDTVGSNTIIVPVTIP